MKLTMLCVLSAAAILTACASTDGESELRGIAAFEGDPRLGAQQNSVCYGREIDGFRDTRQNSVIIEGRRKQEYLVTTNACFNLRDALSLGVASRGGCMSAGDRLIISDTFAPAFGGGAADIDTCFISGIYAWDEDAAKPNDSGTAENEK